MKMSIYPNLAVSGIKKNRQLYLPYILSCIGMIMMNFIIQSVGNSPLLTHMKGGHNISMTLSICKFVIAFFSLIFLIYTNSFLVRRRYKEFGLYNILGMNKKGILRIVAWESLIVAVVSIVTGTVLGIAFSKFAELGLVNAIRQEIDYTFRVSLKAIAYTVEMYGLIFFIIFIKSLIQVAMTKPLDLLHSENLGEKPPKANWLLAIAGVVILGVAYYIAVSIESPLRAFVMFFVAVAMVILATYMIFTAGSVALCKMLQNNKNYYYKKNHFVSVSSMVYRMKRNGAGLASICILSTMVLVMFSSTASLYIGAEDTLKAAYPREMEVAVLANKLDDLSEENINSLVAGYENVLRENQVEAKNVMSYAGVYFVGLDTSSQSIQTDVDVTAFEINDYDNLRQLFFMTAEQYNSMTGANISVEPGQTYVGTIRCKYTKTNFNLHGVSFDVAGKLDIAPYIGDAFVSLIPSVFFVINDLDELKPLETMADYNGDSVLTIKYYYAFDLDEKPEVITNVYNGLIDTIDHSFVNDGNGYSYSGGCRELERDDFYSTFGGLFFIGIMLCIVFIFATLLIIYYKQISEGYEDKNRFEIMKKVGMNKTDISKSINSQVLTVFFIPLIFAGLHTAFAFPMVWRLLQLFNLRNMTLAIIVNIGSFVVFGIFYVAIYLTTARSYYKIVGE